MINIVLVDDHDLVRTAIKRILRDVEGLKVVGEATTGEAAVLLARQLNPDVMIMDIHMPGIGGIEASRKILRYNPDIKILILTMYENQVYSSLLHQAGAVGYITKSCTLEELIHAIRAAHSGQLHLNTSIMRQKVANSSTQLDRSLTDLLSARDLQIMLMLIQGLSIKRISKLLCLSPKTVHTNRYSILKKLSVKNDVELTLLATRLGLLENM